MNEIWKPINGFENYEVSSHGRVRTMLGYKQYPVGHILRPSKSKDTYLKVSLRKDKKYYYFRVHRLVANEFLEKSNENLVLHNDGNSLNNHYSNLRWGSQSENLKDRAKHGTVPRGDKSPNHKLNSNIVKEIRSCVGNCKEISDKYGLSYSTVYDILTKRTWSHI